MAAEIPGAHLGLTLLSCRPLVCPASTKTLSRFQGLHSLAHYGHHGNFQQSHCCACLLSSTTAATAVRQTPRQGCCDYPHTWISRSNLFTRSKLSKTTPPHYRTITVLGQITPQQVVLEPFGSMPFCLVSGSNTLLIQSPSLSIVLQRAPPSAYG